MDKWALCQWVNSSTVPRIAGHGCHVSSESCLLLVHRTGALHNSQRALCKDREVWDRDRRRDRNAETDTVHLNAHTHIISKQICSANDDDLTHYNKLVFSGRTCYILRYTVWTGAVLYNAVVKSAAAFKRICDWRRPFWIKMPILLHNSLLKIDNKRRYHGRRFEPHCSVLFINTPALNWPQHTLHLD